ncbi:hypothetical protein [Roseateles sp.]|uniref:hypothetical protein n=1 Tax=Roseateles sp. TaxID=1971397 RepID=UPI0039ED0E89
MKRLIQASVLALMAGAGNSFAAGRAELVSGGDRHEVVVAFDALFDTEGRVAELRAHEEAEHPASFWAGLRQRVAGLKVPPPRSPSGRPAALRTGLYITLEVMRGDQEGKVRIIGMDVRPLVIRRDYAGYPLDVGQSAGWGGAVEAECLVDTAGRCGEVKVKALPGMPPSVLRWAAATLALWEFRPPQYDGESIAASFRQSFQLSTADDAPVEFRYRGSGNAPFRW